MLLKIIVTVFLVLLRCLKVYFSDIIKYIQLIYTMTGMFQNNLGGREWGTDEKKLATNW